MNPQNPNTEGNPIPAQNMVQPPVYYPTPDQMNGQVMPVMPMKPKKKFKKRWIIIPSIFFAFIVIVTILSLFIRLGDQVVASTVLDAMGMHKEALGVDLLGKNGNRNFDDLMAKLGGVNLAKPSSCENLWGSVKKASLIETSESKYSSKFTVEAKPLNQSYQDSFFYQLYVEDGVDWNNQNIATNLDTALGLNMDIVINAIMPSLESNLDTTADEEDLKFYQDELKYYQGKLATADDSMKSYYQSEIDYYTGRIKSIQDSIDLKNNAKKSLNDIKNLGWGESTASLSGQGYVSANGGYVSVNGIELKTQKFDSKSKLDGWYGQSFNLSKTQKEGLQEIISVLKEILNTKGEQVFSDTTGQFFMKLTCSMIQDIQVGAPEDQTFGYGTHAITKKVRPVKIVLKTDLNKVILDNTVELMQRLYDDETFKSFLKSQYSNYVKVIDGAGKLTNDNIPAPTRSEYEKYIQDWMNSTLGPDARDRVGESVKSYNSSSSSSKSTEGYQVETSTVYYVAMDSGNLYGSKQKVTVTFDDGYLVNNVKDTKLREVLSKGLTVEEDSYDQKSGNDALNINEPSSDKNYQKLYEDIQNTEPVKKVLDIFKK